VKVIFCHIGPIVSGRILVPHDEIHCIFVVTSAISSLHMSEVPSIFFMITHDHAVAMEFLHQVSATIKAGRFEAFCLTQNTQVCPTMGLSTPLQGGSFARGGPGKGLGSDVCA
jgi:hypothetical protein